MTNHSNLSPARWTQFSLDQQILMIANEMNRASKLMAPADRDRLLGCYARALQLADLTVEVQPRRALRRELLRWRDLIAQLYAAPAPDPAAHQAALRCLLRDECGLYLVGRLDALQRDPCDGPHGSLRALRAARRRGGDPAAGAS